jgi:hypothetical protein
MALLAALLLVPTAVAADPIEVLRDCQDDDVLQGDYTLKELREARDALPTDVDEYSPCRDVLSRAIAKKTSASSTPDPGTSGGGDPTGSSGGGGTGPAAARVPTPAAEAAAAASRARSSAPTPAARRPPPRRRTKR